MTNKEKQNKEQKKEKKNHTWKKKEVSLLCPNFKPASNQTNIYIFNFFIILKNLDFFGKENRK
jgi:hypothetical protein